MLLHNKSTAILFFYQWVKNSFILGLFFLFASIILIQNELQLNYYNSNRALVQSDGHLIQSHYPSNNSLTKDHIEPISSEGTAYPLYQSLISLLSRVPVSIEDDWPTVSIKESTSSSLNSKSAIEYALKILIGEPESGCKRPVIPVIIILLTSSWATSPLLTVL